MRNTLFGALLAALLAATPLASKPAHALALSTPAGMNAAIDETRIAAEPIQYRRYYGYRGYGYRGYGYRGYGYRGYGYRGYYRPYGYRPYRAYYGYRPYRPYYGYYRPYYRRAYYGYYRPWRPYYRPAFYAPRVYVGFGFGRPWGWGHRGWW